MHNETLCRQDMPKIVLTVENGHDSKLEDAVLFNPIPNADHVLKVIMASAGFRTAQITRKNDRHVTASFVTEPPLDFHTKQSKRALPVEYNTSILDSLLPGAALDIASLSKSMPSTQWVEDGGGTILDLPSKYLRVRDQLTAKVQQPHLEVSRRTLQNASDLRKLPLVVASVPGTYTIGYTRYSKRLHAVQGAELKHGDVITDSGGREWYYLHRRLADRLPATLTASTVQLQGDPWVPASPLQLQSTRDTSLPALWESAPYEITLVWPDGAQVVVTGDLLPMKDKRAPVWRLDRRHATVEHPKAQCWSTDGVALDYPTAEECVKHGGVWDRPCGVDTECPFYDSRQGRGGCNNGFCEMPLGLQSISFRQAGPGQPMRRGCTPVDPSYPWCTQNDTETDALRFSRTAREH